MHYIITSIITKNNLKIIYSSILIQVHMLFYFIFFFRHIALLIFLPLLFLIGARSLSTINRKKLFMNDKDRPKLFAISSIIYIPMSNKAHNKKDFFKKIFKL